MTDFVVCLSLFLFRKLVFYFSSLFWSQLSPLTASSVPAEGSALAAGEISASGGGDSEWDFSNLVQLPLSAAGALPQLYMVDQIDLETINPDFFTGSDLQTDCIMPRGNNYINQFVFWRLSVFLRNPTTGNPKSYLCFGIILSFGY